MMSKDLTKRFPAISIYGIIYVATHPERATKPDPYHQRTFSRHTDALTGAINVVVASSLSDMTAYKLSRMIDSGEVPVTFGTAYADATGWEPDIST